MAQFRPLIILLLLLSPPVLAGNTIELSDCRIGAGEGYPTHKARCAWLKRPLNPDDPASESIELRVAVVAALDLNPEPDPVVPVAGGPGQGSIEFYSGYAAAFEPLRRNRDIVLIDQRGTGQSARMDCPFDDDVASGEFTTELTRQYTQECLEQLPHDPAYFTTSIAVRDLEAVRKALGYPQLNLYGISYGSRVAQHYARRYPAATRSVVIDGVVPPQQPLGPEIALESQRALERIFARCAADAACADRFPALAERFAALFTELEQSPLLLELPHPLSGRLETLSFGAAEMAAALRLLAYSPDTIALIPLMVHEATEGNFIPLAAQFLSTNINLTDSLALGMHNSVMCSEDVPFYNEELIDREALQASYMGEEQIDALYAICSLWPRGPVDDGFHEPLAGDTPVLLLSGDADPITPPAYAELAASKLENHELLTGINQGHGLMIAGCTSKIVATFVAELDPDTLDTSCMDNNFYMPFFLEFSGPQP